MFYDRFSLANTLAASRFNGVVQQQYVIANPDFYPALPTISSISEGAMAKEKEKAPPLPAPSAPAKAVAPAESVTPAQAGAQSSSAPKAAEPTPKLEGFAVQVGAFRDEEKLKQARAKLSAAGVAHYIERRDTATGELTRLRAGPFATREAADKALGAVKAASLDGQVVPLP